MVSHTQLPLPQFGPQFDGISLPFLSVYGLLQGLEMQKSAPCICFRDNGGHDRKTGQADSLQDFMIGNHIV